MTFLHSGLLAALVLTAVPVLLHLLLKQKPKKIDFPALRLVQSRTKRSTKRLRLRHLLLLALRVLVICGMVFAAARPLLPAADWSFRWWEGALFAGLLVAAYFGSRVWTSKASTIPAQAVREQRTRQGQMAIWAGAALLGLLLICLPYASRVRASMSEAPTAEDLNLPIAGVVVFDVSASMSYLEAGQTLLDVGRQIFADHVGELPEGSRVCVTDNASDQPLLFQVSLSSVPGQLERLTPSADARSLNGAVADALELHRQDRERVMSEGADLDRYVRRIYVVTDRAKTAWQFPDPFDLDAQLAAEDAPSLYVLDVGVESPRNQGLAPVSLSSEELPRGGYLGIRSRFFSTIDQSTSVDLLMSDGGEPAKVASQEAGVDGESLAFLPTMSFEGDSVDGTVRLSSTDPLSIDDARFFSVGVAALPKVLVVKDSSTELGVAWELLGGAAGDVGFSVYSMTEQTPAELTEQSLQGQDVVCLVNAGSLSDDQWRLLTRFVSEGGGLAVFLGDEAIDSFSYNRAVAQEVLPAKLDVFGSRPDDDMAGLVFVKKTGPFMDRLASYEGSPEVFEDAIAVKRFWRVQPHSDANVIARYTFDALPALISRQVGKGTTLMLSTGFNRKPRRAIWNNFLQPYSGDYWPPLLFLDQSIRHLARVGSERRNFVAGEIPTVRVPEDALQERLLLRTPDLRNLPVEPSSENILVLPMADVPGHYAIATAGGKVLARFSVNHRVEESMLEQATVDDLASVFGEKSFEVARSLAELNEEIDVARFGQEAFPMLVLFAVLFFAGETLLSSRFYGDDGGNPSSRGTRGNSSSGSAVQSSLSESEATLS